MSRSSWRSRRARDRAPSRRRCRRSPPPSAATACSSRRRRSMRAARTVHRRRYADARDFDRKAIVAARADEIAGVDQGLHDFLGEEWIAAGLAMHPGRRRSPRSHGRRADRRAARALPGPRGASASGRYHGRCIHSARYSGRKFTTSSADEPATASTHAATSASLAASSQCRSSITTTRCRALACGSWIARRSTSKT